MNNKRQVYINDLLQRYKEAFFKANRKTVESDYNLVYENGWFIFYDLFFSKGAKYRAKKMEEMILTLEKRERQILY